MNKILYGSRVFEDKDIKSGNLYLAMSLSSSVLEVDTLDVVIESDDTSLSEFVRNDTMIYYNNNKRIGTYYVSDVTRIAINQYHFSATSTIGLLDQTKHYGGIYTGQTAEEVILDICGGFPVSVKTNIANTKLYGWLPVATRRENLSQVLFAIGASLKTDANGTMRISGLYQGVTAEIPEDDIFLGGNVRSGSAPEAIIVSEHQYIPGSETEVLFEGTADAGDIIVFNQPAHSLTAQGFSILERGANHVVVSTGTGSISGKPYIHTTREIRKGARSTDNVITVKNATLISLANALAVANRLWDYYGYTKTAENDVVYNWEQPGDIVSSVDAYKYEMEACLVNADINFSSVLRSKETYLKNFIPPDIGVQDYYDLSDYITLTGTWTAPDDVYNIRVVLIQEGTAGTNGGKGGDGTGAAGTSSSASSTNNYKSITLGPLETATYAAGSGGRGGDAGKPGVQGRVYQIDLAVTPGEVFSVTVSRNGSGGHSVFGQHSSVSGSILPGGFADPFTGKIHAQPGVDGKAGYNGGGGGSANQSSSSNGSPSGDGRAGGAKYYRSSYVTVSSYDYDSYGGGGRGGLGGSTSGGYIASDANSLGPGYGGIPSAGGAVGTWESGVYGCAGNGGHGGGGGGGAGGVYARNGYSSAGSTKSVRLRYGHTGAFGSAGGLGTQGAIIVFFRAPIQKSSGRFITNDGKQFNDLTNMPFVV